jgi:hypothetical protein
MCAGSLQLILTNISWDWANQYCSFLCKDPSQAHTGFKNFFMVVRGAIMVVRGAIMVVRGAVVLVRGAIVA